MLSDYVTNVLALDVSSARFIVGWGNEFVHLHWKDKQDAKFENRSGLYSSADGLHHRICAVM